MKQMYNEVRANLTRESEHSKESETFRQNPLNS